MGWLSRWRGPASSPRTVRKVDLTNFKVATSETARKIYRQITLNLLRRLQPMSRADLARRSGSAAQHRVRDRQIN